MSARIVFIETYFAGSHARIAELLSFYSRHDITLSQLGPDHWRWRALAAHHDIAVLLERAGDKPPDALIASGPIQLPGLLAVLPARWREIPRAIYFHETQWTYPAVPYDPRPYLVGHLDALHVADRVWFNSHYHQDMFRTAALENQSSRLRSLARRVLAENWHKASVLYPPVSVDRGLTYSDRPVRALPRICWVARWEREKRPDRFVAAIEQLRLTHPDLELAVFRGGSQRSLEDDPLYARIADLDALQRPLLSRHDYERELVCCDVLVSTAEHEFFGVAAVEAAMLGVVPLVPDDLAYPETLPSAPRYQSGDIDGLVRALRGIVGRQWRSPAPWQVDSERFAPERSVAAFDRAICELLSER